ncbi:MAG: hypothetical protein A2Y45_07340 [Tenericutes bacterium GWC2_34_14]|nr:MAG: hypothetical protein A2Z84_06820 [Tenericutes bacterium GWA2_35_7]OHE29721.1 MAG: hypothetical protein A2Y45_07340 [Tenericutes bacterium GWC2_34_14]OHE34700.1 MAG: hypothetical protein A2012_00950 [Tenericutes bacterium GWE2_34_108]OHE37439.1 MAG: hypothetical protein A2Y46_02060 [Tenericutes bacterium GWF1_35_14]OHE39426.1 MAG: hypothetical protein A2Y44_00800 [Tenericutes bacterium GWF2_35_184]OHE44384.1 MAG: hypothetical protein A2221_04710 [Tenericutes bacterium RIFOXYA2_FULL_36_3
MNFIKKLATKSMLIEWLLVITIIFALDTIFILRYGFTISFRHWIIAFFNVAVVLSAISFIASYKKRFIMYTVFILVMFTFFITDSVLYFFKDDVTSIAMLLESARNTMEIGLKYNPLYAYTLPQWILISVFVFGMAYVLNRIVKMRYAKHERHFTKHAIYFALSVLGLWLTPKIIDHADQILFDTPSDKALFVQKFGSITYHAKDIITYTSNAIKPLIYKDEYVVDINEEAGDEFAPTSDLFGMFEGKNVIMIMCETCEEYAFSPEYTPNYYRLRNQSMYFTNFFSAAKSNYTYDAEFKSLTSLMYFQGDNYMYTHADNAYPTALPEMLRREGYNTHSFHNFYSDFFNRDEMHMSIGFEHYLGFEGLGIEEDESWPLDSIMFETYKDKIAPVQDNPFFSFVLTVTPHGPHDEYRESLKAYYDILEQDPRYQDESLEYKTITAAQMNFDEGLGIMLDDLESKGLMDDTIIVMFSDHKNYSSQEITIEKTENSDIPFEIEKVPFLMYLPGFEAVETQMLASHYDITPTLLDLLGISSYKDFYYGQSLFIDEREDRPIILSYSNWISSSYRVRFGEVVYGEVDIQTFLDTQQEIYETIQFYEKIFFSDYFRTENPYYLVQMITEEIE